MANTFIRAIKDKDNPFVMLRKEPLQDDSLSWKAKGILSYLLSLPDDWQIYETELIKHSIDGRDSLKSGIAELLKAGYLTREPSRNEQGHFKGYKYKVYELNHRNGLSVTENPTTENPTSENPLLLNNNSTNNDSNNIKEYSSAEAKLQIPYKAIIDYLNEKTNKSYSYKSSGNRKLIQARFNEGYQLEDFKKVIDTKNEQWKDEPQMQQYLRPATLFSQKFDGYLNEKSKQEPKKKFKNFGLEF